MCKTIKEDFEEAGFEGMEKIEKYGSFCKNLGDIKDLVVNVN